MNSVYSLRQEDAFQALVQVDDEGEIAYDASVAIRATALCGLEFGSDFEPVKLSWGTPRRNNTKDIQTMLSPFLVDMEASKFKIYPQATVFNKIVLMVDRVRNVSIFRLKESPAGVFVSDQFKHAVQANNLKGVDFGNAIALSSKSSSQP
ncbi:imm11 family protein [Burkholderia ubonensis]|uniref:imm11 family protein n=1 Tax=Burkholderia ubonensis TaxID=101571 RepID=UPI0009B43212|nr:DUF1629 domain-containing protein [Burkholderia ubonensis]